MGVATVLLFAGLTSGVVWALILEPGYLRAEDVFPIAEQPFNETEAVFLETRSSRNVGDVDPSLDRVFGLRVCRENAWERAGSTFDEVLEGAGGKQISRVVARVKALRRASGPGDSLTYVPHYLVAQKLNVRPGSDGHGFGQWPGLLRDGRGADRIHPTAVEARSDGTRCL